jgi:hypothetical protein
MAKIAKSDQKTMVERLMWKRYLVVGAMRLNNRATDVLAAVMAAIPRNWQA